ncbi:hypothetical protein POM88_040022 [Heracleum sosnowskyi]|uniref:D-isomer specific 2-hydroxyacid dehydrogenase catalytic domain-containing protein n=1 Tax=Heracleum sosnowskyi TaxID=360622 RepID=A0AAD8HCE7_9APIA|nr:hypothetical protein POM88_040022 [Heracleum sosnowskyi]
MATFHEKTSPELSKVLWNLHFPLTGSSLVSTHAQSIQALFCNSLTPVTADTLGLLPLLRLVVTSSVGVDHIDLHECRRRGIKVANIAKIFKDDVADIAVGFLIDVLRKVTAGDKFVRSGSRLWSDFPLGYKCCFSGSYSS